MKILSAEHLQNIANVSWAMATSMVKPKISEGGMAHGNSPGDTYPQCTTGGTGQAPHGGCKVAAEYVLKGSVTCSYVKNRKCQ